MIQEFLPVFITAFEIIEITAFFTPMGVCRRLLFCLPVIQPSLARQYRNAAHHFFIRYNEMSRPVTNDKNSVMGLCRFVYCTNFRQSHLTLLTFRAIYRTQANYRKQHKMTRSSLKMESKSAKIDLMNFICSEVLKWRILGTING